MKDVQLIRLDPATEASLADDPAYMEAMVEDNWARVADLVHKHVGRTLTSVPVSVDKGEPLQTERHSALDPSERTPRARRW